LRQAAACAQNRVFHVRVYLVLHCAITRPAACHSRIPLQENRYRCVASIYNPDADCPACRRDIPPMTDKVEQESLMVPVSSTVQLHLRRIWSGTQGTAPPLLLLHGAAEDGHIFYSHSGRGLACWLARNGYEVFVPSTRTAVSVSTRWFAPIFPRSLRP
jgi:hypothetical protein